jgi:hypothetical protein
MVFCEKKVLGTGLNTLKKSLNINLSASKTGERSHQIPCVHHLPFASKKSQIIKLDVLIKMFKSRFCLLFLVDFIG